MTDRPVNDHSFEQFLGEEKLMGARCSACNTLFVPPRSVCVKCYSSRMAWTEVKGTGTLANIQGRPCAHSAHYAVLEGPHGSS